MKGKVMRRIRVVVLALVCSVGAIVGVAAPSYAGTEDCMKGWACVWEHNSYEGRVYGTNKNLAGFTHLINEGSSVSAHGGKCKQTRFYDDWSYVSELPKGNSFVLNSKHFYNHGFRDPNLRNGAGSSTRNFNDTLESLNFINCVS